MDSIKRVFKYAFKPKRYIVIAFILVVIETSFELLIPFVMSSLIDDGVKTGNMNHIYFTGIIIFICAIISLLTGYLYSKFAAKAAAVFGENIRNALFEKIESFSFSNLDHFQSSSLVTRVINDAQLMQNTLTTVLRPLARSPIMLILGIVLSFIINPTLSLVFIIMTPILAAIMLILFKIVSPRFLKLQRGLDNLNLVLQETLISIKTIKAFVKEGYQEEKFEEVNRGYTSIVEKTFRIINIGTPLSQFMIYTATIVIMWVGGNLMINSVIQEGDLTGVFSYTMQTFNSIMMLSNILISIARSLASLYRVDEVLKETPTIVNGEDLKKVKDGEITFENVDFKYSSSADNYVLKNISFTIKSGEIIGIIGETGSGKSTLAELMLRLYDITNGKISIDGENIKDYSLENLRENIAIVLQKNYLFSGTLKDNLLWGNKQASDEELFQAMKDACVDEFFPRLQGGLNYELGVNGGNVSGGQKQRICIARALLKKPKILILDDSTSALDNNTEKRLMQNLSSMHNMTTIIITQRLNSLILADRVMVLSDGQISGFDTKEKLLENNEIFKEFYKSQMKVQENG